MRSVWVIAAAILLAGCGRKATVSQAPARPIQPLPRPAHPKAVVRAKPAQEAAAVPVAGPPLSEYLPAEQRAEALGRYETAVRTIQDRLLQLKKQGGLSAGAAKSVSRAEASLRLAQAAFRQGNLSEALTHAQRATVFLQDI